MKGRFDKMTKLKSLFLLLVASVLLLSACGEEKKAENNEASKEPGENYELVKQR